MIKIKERKPYWRQTKTQMAASLLPTLFALIALPMGIRWFGTGRFLEFPLGYYLVAHGLILLLIGAVAYFMLRQDEIDRLHGAHEDL